MAKRLLLVAVLLALATGAGALDGANGHTTTEVLSVEDVTEDLPEWDLPLFWFGNDNFVAGKPHHEIAVDGSGKIYVVVAGWDPDGDGYLGAATTGVVSADGSTLETVQSSSFGYNSAGTVFTSSWQAVVIADFSNDLVDDGDLLLVRSISDYSNNSGSVEVYVLPADGSDDPELIFELTDTRTPWQADLVAAADGTLFLRGFGVHRLDYASGAYSGDRVLGHDLSSNFAMVLGPDGYLYGHLNIPNDKTIYRVDPDGLDSYEAFATAQYYSSQTSGLAFDAKDKLWVATFHKKKTPRNYLAKMNKKGKFPWRKRIAEWGYDGTSGYEGMRTLLTGGDGELYAVVYDFENGLSVPEMRHSIWRID